MACECDKELCEKIKTEFADHYKKPIIRVDHPGKILSLSQSLTMRYSIGFLVELEGQKKKPVVPVAYCFCPFCGVKFNDD